MPRVRPVQPAAPLAAVLLLAPGLLAGCAHKALRPEDVASAATAWLQAEDPKAVGIFWIDGRAANSWNGVSTSLELTPGMHEVVIASRLGAMQVSSYQIRLQTEAGHLYRIKHHPAKVGNRSLANVWIVDAAADKEVGETLSIANVPVTEVMPAFSHPFYNWRLPQNEGWVVVRRDSGGATLGRDGASRNETRIISMSLHVLPALASEQDFIDFVKKSRLSPDSGRFETIEDTVIPYKGPVPFCAEVHYLAIDKSPKKGLTWGGLALVEIAMRSTLLKLPPMTLEGYGYACRLPDNPGLAIYLEYSQRRFEPGKEPGMRELAQAYFSAVELTPAKAPKPGAQGPVP